MSDPRETSVETSGDWDRYAPAPRHGGARLPLGAHPWNTGGKKGRSGGRSRAKALEAWCALPDDVKRRELLRLFDNDTHRAELVALLSVPDEEPR